MTSAGVAMRSSISGTMARPTTVAAMHSRNVSAMVVCTASCRRALSCAP